MGLDMVFVKVEARSRTECSTLATPAARFLATVSDWGASDVGLEAVTEWGRAILGVYKYTLIENTGLLLCTSAADVVEIQQVVSRPPKAGSGTRALRRVCELADTLGVTLWLDALPFGEKENISDDKLRQWYRGFGFLAVEAIDSRWLNSYHQKYQNAWCYPMRRNPADGSRR